MSGRLIITTKKTYCPWNPANVERVLRDERLERERIERQQQQEQSTEEERRRRHGEETQQHDEHINLFPEAREAELRLAQKGGLLAAKDNDNDDTEKKQTGILPVPLGGEESINRKRGNVPFYLQTSSSSKTATDHHQYNNGMSYLGIRGRGRAAATSSDEITNSIMRDQFASREEYRKRKNDPMSRFYVDDDNDVDNIYADKEGRSFRAHDIQIKSNGQVDGEDREGVNNYYPMGRHEQEDEQKKRSLSSRRKGKSSALQNEEKNSGSSEISSSSSSSESSSSSSSCRDRKRRRHRNEHHDRKRKRSRQHSYQRRHRSESPSSHKKKKKHKKRYKHKKIRGECKNQKDDTDGHNKRQHSQPSLSNNDQKEREEMRQRRRAREAREMERQRQL